ncbi:MAG: AarF/ABC1/UbiB kinase family protein [Lewinellaceae bacterium]|nr:AarF/ABC1/UbiB kinase family protein [Lewinellaceae bacterium]
MAQGIYRRNHRVRKAYWTATIIIVSYLRLLLARRLWGQAYFDRRITALHIRNAQRIKRTILALNGLFIKVGQLLSVLGTFLPEAFQQPLEELQDRVPPRPFSEVRQRIIQELGQPPEVLFQKMEENPVAAASIGQVHRAWLPDGTAVAVKVQHVHIAQTARVDLEIIRRLTRLSAWFFNIKGMDYLYTQVRQMIEEELDFQKEAQAMKRIGDQLAGEPGWTVPTVHPQLSSEGVLTTSWSEGIKITQTDQLDLWGIDRPALIRRLLKGYCQMVFRDGYYHADPHPGNVLVRQDGTLVLLDFGAVAELSPQLREGIPVLLEAILMQDTATMIAVSRKIGFLAEGQEAEEMAAKMITAMRTFLQEEIRIQGLNFKDIQVDPVNNSLVKLLREVGLQGISGTVQVPKDYVLLNRMFTLLLGICITVAPGLNPLDVIRPYLKNFISAGKKGGLLTTLTRVLRRTAGDALALPKELRNFLEEARAGNLVVRSPEIRQGTQMLYLVGQQLILGILTLGIIHLGFTFQEAGALHASQVSYGFSAFLGVLFLRLSWLSYRKSNL